MAILYSVTWGICAFKVIPYLLKPKEGKRRDNTLAFSSQTEADVVLKMDSNVSDQGLLEEVKDGQVNKTPSNMTVSPKQLSVEPNQRSPDSSRGMFSTIKNKYI